MMVALKSRPDCGDDLDLGMADQQQFRAFIGKRPHVRGVPRLCRCANGSHTLVCRLHK